MVNKRRIAALTAEFLGTAVLSFAFLTVSRSTIGIPYFYGLAAGLAVVLMGLVMMREVHLNPALTLGLWTGRRIRTVKAVSFIAAQLLGGWAAYALYKYLAHAPIQAVPATFNSRLLTAEAAGTFVLAFAVAAMVYQRAHWAVRSAVMGLAYMLGIIVASSASNGFINPAVALSSHGWIWTVTVLGPVLGAVIGVNLYGLLFTTTPAKPAAVAEAVVAKPVEKVKAKKTTTKSKKK